MRSPVTPLGVVCALVLCGPMACATVTITHEPDITGRDQNSSTTVNYTSSFATVYGSKPLTGAFYTTVTLGINAISTSGQAQGFLVNGSGDNNVTGNGAVPNFGFISGSNSGRFAVAGLGNNAAVTIGTGLDGKNASWDWNTAEAPQIGEIFTIAASLVWSRPANYNPNERSLVYTYAVTRSDPGGKLAAAERTITYTVESNNRVNDTFMGQLGQLVVKGGGNPPSNNPFQYTVTQIKFSDAPISLVPEPMSLAFAVLGVSGAVLRRKRDFRES